jgi:hypothetical protein
MTAIKFLQHKLNNVKSDEFCSIETIKEWVEQCKKKEKKDIENAFNDGRRWNNSWTGETYYKELFENPNTLGR